MAAVMSSAARLPPRAALRRMWMSLGVAYRICFDISVHKCCLREQNEAWLRGAPIWWLATAELFVLGVASSWPSFRQRVHAALLARDGQISSAASVAALLGRNDIDHVKAEAQRKFYGVELSQVRLEDIQQSTPDPGLFAGRVTLVSTRSIGSFRTRGTTRPRPSIVRCSRRPIYRG